MVFGLPIHVYHLSTIGDLFLNISNMYAMPLLIIIIMGVAK